MIKIINVSKKFYNRATNKPNMVLQNINLTISKNEVVGLIGNSGSGKSTLARILLNLIEYDQGEVLWNGKKMNFLTSKELKKFRKDVQFIAQRPESFFDPRYKLKNSLKEAVNNFKVYNKKEYKKILENLLEKVKLDKSILERYPHQVSGGEIQRVSICRALLLKPRFIVLDEPTSMLDISSQAQILNILKRIQKEEKISYLLIAHNKEILEFMCDRMIRIEKGILIE